MIIIYIHIHYQIRPLLTQLLNDLLIRGFIPVITYITENRRRRKCTDKRIIC